MHHDRFHPPNTVDSTSIDLIRRLKSGDQESWGFLIKVYGPIVSFWVRSAQLSPSDTQDLVQNVFLSVTRGIHQFERAEGKAKFRSWLKTITHNKIRDHFRRNGKDPIAIASIGQLESLESTHINSTLDGDADLTSEENAAIVQSVTHAIKGEFEEKTWQAFWRTAVEGFQASDVARELGISSDAVRKNKSRVLHRLREVLSEYFG